MTPDIPDIARITPEERARALDEVATRIQRYGLQTPAILFLEGFRPLAGLAGMASFAVTPLFGAFIGLDRAERYATLLSDRDAFDDLVDRLDRSRRAAPESATDTQNDVRRDAQTSGN